MSLTFRCELCQKKFPVEYTSDSDKPIFKDPSGKPYDLGIRREYCEMCLLGIQTARNTGAETYEKKYIEDIKSKLKEEL